MSTPEERSANGPYPTELERLPDGGIRIHWSDEVVMAYAPSRLRRHCPCATCREKRQSEEPEDSVALPVLSAAETQPLKIVAMRPVGQYAYNIAFSDGHTSGIFTLELLRELGQSSAAG